MARQRRRSSPALSAVARLSRISTGAGHSQPSPMSACSGGTRPRHRVAFRLSPRGRLSRNGIRASGLGDRGDPDPRVEPPCRTSTSRSRRPCRLGARFEKLVALRRLLLTISSRSAKRLGFRDERRLRRWVSSTRTRPSDGRSLDRRLVPDRRSRSLAVGRPRVDSIVPAHAAFWRRAFLEMSRDVADPLLSGWPSPARV